MERKVKADGQTPEQSLQVGCREPRSCEWQVEPSWPEWRPLGQTHWRYHVRQDLRQGGEFGPSLMCDQGPYQIEQTLREASGMIEKVFRED